jgi:hypothetical protein
LYASNDGTRAKTSRHLLRGKKQPQALSLNFANTGSVAALLSFQAFDNDLYHLESLVILACGKLQRERFLGKAFLILTLAHKLFLSTKSDQAAINRRTRC